MRDSLFKEFRSRISHSKRWKIENPEKYRIDRNTQNEKWRLKREHWKNKVFEYFNNSCVRCKFSDKRALQIDHINGGGIFDNKSRSHRYYEEVLNSLINQENRFQVLCANCNWIKRYENREQGNYIKHSLLAHKRDKENA